MWIKHEMSEGVMWHRVEGAVLESVAMGQLDETNPAILTKALERCHAEHGWCGAFHDWEQVSAYTTRMRVDWVRWATSPAARSARFSHFRLGDAPLLKMAVTVASVAFSPQQFIIHPTAVAYAAARQAHMTKPDRIPELGARRI